MTGPYLRRGGPAASGMASLWRCREPKDLRQILAQISSSGKITDAFSSLARRNNFRAISKKLHLVCRSGLVRGGASVVHAFVGHLEPTKPFCFVFIEIHYLLVL